MTSDRGRVRFITLADDDQRPVGVVSDGGAGWTLNCGVCTHSRPSSTPDTAVAELLLHIDRAHPAPVASEAAAVTEQAT